MSAWLNDVAHRGGDTDFSQSKERTRELTGPTANQMRGVRVVGWSCCHKSADVQNSWGFFFSSHISATAELKRFY